MGIVYDDDAPTTIQYDAPPPAQTWGDTLHNAREGMDASVQGVVRGIPIIGPLLDKGVNAVAAAPAALTPGGFTDKYNTIASGGNRIAAEHPVASTVGEVAGSTMATVPAGRAFPKVFGGNTFLGQTGAGRQLGGTDAFYSAVC